MARSRRVARMRGADEASMVVVWDELTGGRRFLDPLTPDETRAIDAANRDVCEVALELVAAAG